MSLGSWGPCSMSRYHSQSTCYRSPELRHSTRSIIPDYTCVLFLFAYCAVYTYSVLQILATTAPFIPPPLLLFEACLANLWSIWECLVLCEPILVFGPSPAETSQAVWWLRDLLRPVRTAFCSFPGAADICCRFLWLVTLGPTSQCKIAITRSL